MALGGDILIKLGADVAELRTGFAQAKSELSGFQGAVEKFGDKVTEIFKGALAAFSVEKISEFIKQSKELVGGFVEGASAAGLSTTAYQAFTEAALRGGVGADQFGAALNKLNKEITSAVNGDKAAIETFDRLGVKILDANGKLRSNADISSEVARRILAISDPALQSGRSMEFFGKGGAIMVPVLRDLAHGADELASALASRGGIASSETIERLNQAHAALESTFRVLAVQAATIAANLSSDLTPLLAKVEELGNAFVRLSEHIKESAEASKKAKEAAAATTPDTGSPFSQGSATPKTGGNPLTGTFDAMTHTSISKLISQDIDDVTRLIEFADSFGDHWTAAVADVSVRFNELSAKVKNFLTTPLIGGAKEAEADLNKITDAARILLGFNPLTLDVAVTGVDAATTHLEALKNRAEAMHAILNMQTPVTNAQGVPFGNSLFPAAALQAVGGAGGTRNPPVVSSGPGPRDRVAELLKQLELRQQGEEKTLKLLQDASINTPVRELDHQADVAKKIADTIAEVASRQRGGATPETIARVTAQVTATEEAAQKTKLYREALQLALDTEKQYGDGTKVAREEISKLNDAYTTGRLTTEAYNEAMRKITVTQREQALASAGQVQGIAGVAAGFEASALKFSENNRAFAQGGQLFDGTISIMDSAVQEFASTGEISFQKILASFAAMLAQMALKAAASEVFKAFLGGGGAGGGTGAGLFDSLFVAVAGSPFGFAGGGRPPVGRVSVVGENGPELFIPDNAGRIVSNANTMAAFSDTTSGQTINQTINFSLGVVPTVRAEIQKMLPQLAEAGASRAQTLRQRGGSFKQSFKG